MLPSESLENLAQNILNNFVVVDDGKEVKDIKKVRIELSPQGDWRIKIIV